MQKSEASKTLTVIALALLVAYYLWDIRVLLHGVAVLLFLAAFPNRVSRFIAASWLRFSELIGGVNSRVLLTLVYFLVLVPVSFFYRRFNRKMVDYFAGRNLESCFLDSTRNYDREMFEKTW